MEGIPSTFAIGGGCALILIPAGVVIMPSILGDMAMVSKIFSLGFHFLLESRRPLGDMGDSAAPLLLLEAAAAAPVEESPHEKASLATSGDCIDNGFSPACI